jgi:hypothetical protein
MSKRYIKRRDFHEGLAAVLNPRGLWGFINKNLKEVIPCQFRKVRDFSEGFAGVFDGKACGFINRKGDLIIPYKYETINIRSNKNDNWWGVREFKEGLAPVCIKYNKATPYFKGTVNLWGYVDPNGEEVIKCKYYSADSFKEGRAIVSVSHSEKGIIDHIGNEIAPCKYSYIGEFNDGLALVNMGYQGHSYGYIDINGVEVIPCQYYKAEPFSEGMAVVIIGDGWQKREFRIIDVMGNTIFANNKYYSAGIFSEGLLPVLQSKWGCIDRYGKEKIPFKYDHIGKFVNGFAKVGLNGIEGVIDRSGGSVIIINNVYQYKSIDIIGKFKNEYALINHEGKFGLIGTDGSYILDPIYDYIDTLYDDIIKVSKGGVFDKDWKRDWQGKYLYYNQGKYGLVHVHYGEITQCIYNLISNSDGLFFRAERDDNFFLIDKNGKEINYTKQDWLCLKENDFDKITNLIYNLIHKKLEIFFENELFELIHEYINYSQIEFDQLCDKVIVRYLTDINIDEIINSYKIIINVGSIYRRGDTSDDAWIELVSITGDKRPDCPVRQLGYPVYDYKGDIYIESLFPYYFENIHSDHSYGASYMLQFEYRDCQERLFNKSSELTENYKLKAKMNYDKNLHYNTLKELIINVIKKAMINLESDIINKERKQGIDFFGLSDLDKVRL